MVTGSLHRKHRKNHSIPSRQHVLEAAAEIRNSWSPEERQRRAVLARYMVMRHFLSLV